MRISCIIFLLSVIAVISLAAEVSPLEDIFTCPPIAPQVNPTDVRRLRPTDIKVVMAAGDSMTAGFAMQDKAWIFSAMFEWRGHAHSIGGDVGAITVPNFLKKLGTKNLQGASVGKELPWDAIQWKKQIIRPHNPRVDFLNAAQSMAKLDRISSDQIDYLVSELHNLTSINFEKDWKLLTIIIGPNDLCVCCDGRNASTPEDWARRYNATIAMIHKRIPRVFVNIVTMFNISQVFEIAKGSTYCNFVVNYLNECPCLVKTERERQIMDDFSTAYSHKLIEIAKYWNSLGLQEFTVSAQTYTQNMKITNLQFVSNLDCFHPSMTANRLMAVGLWNSMLLPPGKKPTDVTPDIKVICPDENTFLQ